MEEGRSVPVLEGEEEARLAPVPFSKLHRRAGDRLGLYMAETKNRFVVSDGQREQLLLLGAGLVLALALVLCVVARAFAVEGLFILVGLLLALLGVQVAGMRRLTTTLDRRRRRVLQETTRAGCCARRSELDLEDVVRMRREGNGRSAIIVMELSSGETVPLTYPGWMDVADLKEIGPSRMNNFLLRIRGGAKRKFPPSHVQARADREAEEAGDLSIVRGDVIKVLSAPENSGWWEGKLRSGETGMFPVGWTQELAPSDLAAAAIALQQQEEEGIAANSEDDK